MKNKQIWIFVGIFTCLFSVVLLFGYISFFVSGKSFVWNSDGKIQHLPSLIYMGRYLREFVRNILSGNIIIPLFDFKIGLGEDIATSLRVQSVPISPLNLLSLFIPTRLMEWYYDIVVILRLYFSGLAFAYFLWTVTKTKKWAILIGALIYTFSGWAIFSAVRHPAFALAMVYTPLLTAGIDRTLRGKKPYLFIGSTFLSALSGFYFLYMETIFLFIYTLIRIHNLHSRQYFKSLMGKGLKIVFYYLTGLFLAAPFFIPIVMAQFNTIRKSHVQVDSLLLYSQNQYFNLFLNSIKSNVSWDHLGMSSISLIALILLFDSSVKHKKHIIAGFAALLILYLIPFGGYLLNGFAYVSGRWTFLFAFAIAFITAYILPDIINLKKTEVFLSALLLTVYGFPVILKNNYRNIYTMTALVFLLATAFCLSIHVDNNPIVIKLGRLPSFSARLLTGANVKITAVILLVTINLTANVHYRMSGSLGKYSNEFSKRGAHVKEYNATLIASDYIDDDSFYREDNLNVLVNVAMIKGYYGINVNHSIINGAYQAAMFEHQNSQQSQLWTISGLDGRAILNTLASVKYITAKEEETAYIPFGYNIAYNKNTVFVNDYCLPLGYTYSLSIPVNGYKGLDAIYKQEAILQAVSLPDEYSNTDINTLQFDTVPVPYTVEKYNDLQWENGVLSVEKNNAVMTLRFAGLANSETYIGLVGLDNNDRLGTRISIKNNKLTKTGHYQFWRNQFYFGKHDYLVNMGYSEKSQDTVTISFLDSGTYKLEDIQVYCLPMNNYPKHIEALREDVLENIVIETNRVTGDITLKEDKILLLSIPYSKGWTAKVNGQYQKLLQANTMFMALQLKPGHHSVELNYFTSGLKTGIILSVIGFTLFIGTFIVLRKNNAEKTITF
ncbi:MAG: YfhO family protein [Treponema sp.]|jgi:uncharacterized membrane protein YfhO|nr:YfhO family protein [Treponema sp.]